MNYRQHLPKSLLLAAVLTACGTVEDRHYTDNEFLERPPTLGVDHPPAGQENITRSEVPEKPDKGLGDDVSINTASPLQIKLARPFDIAWHDLEMALKDMKIEITDREHDKGQYYVTYDPDDYQSEDSGFLDKSTSFFKNDYKQAVYILTVEEDGSDSRISAAIANEAEQSGDDKDGYQGGLTDGADKLLLSLYKNMRDELVEE